MSHFFIGRPVFAAVIAILICLAGAISLATMPVSQFPKLTPPTVSLTCSYDGASAKTMQDSIAQVIEQRMTSLHQHGIQFRRTHEHAPHLRSLR